MVNGEKNSDAQPVGKICAVAYYQHRHCQPRGPVQRKLCAFASVFFKERDISGRPRGPFVNLATFLRESAALFIEPVYSEVLEKR